MIDPEKLILPHPGLRKRFPDLDFTDRFTFQTQGEPIFVTDPIYLANIYHDPGGLASIVRQRGVILKDFGGDRGGFLYWQPPYLLLALGSDFEDDPEVPPFVPWPVGCDSGTFLFLPVTEDLPSALKKKMAAVESRRNGVLVPLPAGEWTVLFEQHPVDNWENADLYRDIVLRWEPSETMQPRLFAF